ncbi:hypothetical protein HDV62DRAFT_367525 [Trichoderma sp. SZMC 28011]
MLDTDKHLDLHLRPSCCPLQSKPTPARSCQTLSIVLLHHALSTLLPCRALPFAMSCLLPCSSHRDETGHYPPLSPPSPLLFFPPGKFFFHHGLPASPLLITEDCFFVLAPKTTRSRPLLALHSHRSERWHQHHEFDQTTIEGGFSERFLPRPSSLVLICINVNANAMRCASLASHLLLLAILQATLTISLARHCYPLCG